MVNARQQLCHSLHVDALHFKMAISGSKRPAEELANRNDQHQSTDQRPSEVSGRSLDKTLRNLQTTHKTH